MKKGLIVTSIIVMISAIVIVGYSLAKITLSDESGENKIQTGSITVTYEEISNSISLISQSGTADETAKTSNNYFAFSIKGSATGKITLDYYIYITPDSNNTLEDTSVKLYLTSVENINDAIDTETELENIKYISEFPQFDVSKYQTDSTSNDRLIHSNTFSFNNDNTTQTRNYRLRVWLDENYETQATNDNGTYTVDTKTYTFKINVASKNK